MRNDPGAQRLFQLLDERSPGAGVIVDAGCGRGVHLRHTRGAEALERERRAGARIIGFDLAEPASPNPYVTEFHLIAAGDPWPVATSTADVVFSDWVLEHVGNPDHYFRECARVLRPGGVLLARTLQKWSIAGIGARLVPDRFHRRMISVLQPRMDLDDVFPTTLLCNTTSAVQDLCRSAGLGIRTEAYGGLDGYGGSSKTLIASLRMIERRLPPAMQHTMVLEAVKPPAPRAEQEWAHGDMVRAAER